MAQIEARMRGRMCRKKIVAQLKAVPRYAGGTTYSLNGVKYLMSEAQYARFVESLECQETDRYPSRLREKNRAEPPIDRRVRAAEGRIKKLVDEAKVRRRSRP